MKISKNIVLVLVFAFVGSGAFGQSKEAWKQLLRDSQSRIEGASGIVLKDLRPPLNSYFAEINAGLFPTTSYGVMAGWCGRYAGVYVKGRTGFNKSSDSCTSAGLYQDASDMWTSGNEKYNHMEATVGTLIRLANGHVFPYVGAGYGTTTALWQDFSGSWLEVSDMKISGVSANLGVMVQYKHALVSIGISSTAFKYCDVEAGIGFMF